MTFREAIDRQRAKERARENLAASGIILGTDVGASLGGLALSRGLADRAKHMIPFDRLKELAALGGINVETDILGGRNNAFYRPAFLSRLLGRPTGEHGTIGMITTGGGRMSLPLDVAAHEVGHGMSWAGKAGMLPQLIARARIPGSMMGAGAGLTGLLKGTMGDKPLAEREKWLNTASIAGGAGMAPVLADEAMASRNAFKLFHRIPGDSAIRQEVARQAVKRLARAWGTYGIGALGLVLGPQLAKGYYRRRHER